MTQLSAGVRGAAVESVEQSGLRCVYSVVDAIAGDPESLQRDALAFHRVTHELFRQTAIVPFRFPTTMSSAEELNAYLREHAAQYHAAFGDFRDRVQMEIRLQFPAAPATPDNSSGGAAYLRARAARARQVEQAIALCRAAIPEEVVDWRQRESSHGVRCFFLMRRNVVGQFQQQIKQVRLPEGLNAAVSGPWPPTEFFPVLA